VARSIRNVCVFAGSRPGARAAYVERAGELGRALASRGWGLVYGGASVGLMGAVADAALAARGTVRGVIPEGLVAKEIAHAGLTELVVTRGMHARKARMNELSDAFVALPGGFGTLDELFEALTWAQLGIHDKPVGLLDVEGYFGPLVEAMDRAVAEGFVPAERRPFVIVESDPGRLLDGLLG
jgi:uncharacterized protein (TIGR00730 family)